MSFFFFLRELLQRRGTTTLGGIPQGNHRRPPKEGQPPQETLRTRHRTGDSQTARATGTSPQKPLVWGSTCCRGLAGAWGRGVWFLSSFGGGVFLGLGLGSVGLRLVVGRSPPVVVVGSCSSRRRLPLFAVVCRCLPRPWPSDRAGCPPAAASPARFWWGWLGLFSPSVWAFRPPGVPVRARCQTAREVLGTPGAGFIATSDVACSAPSPLGLFVPLGLCPSFVLLSVSAWVGLLSPLPLSRPPVVGGAWGLRSL